MQSIYGVTLYLMEKSMNSILTNYDVILDKNHFSPASYFEWNTYKVFEKLGGFIKLKPNFKLTDEGLPSGCAKPGVEDILVEYREFNLLIECSLRSGETQVDYEGNSVARHLNAKKDKTDKDCFSLFIAPTIDISLYKYYSLKKNTTPIIPLNLKQFTKLVIFMNNKFNSINFKNILKDLLNQQLSKEDYYKWPEFIDNYINSL